MVKALAAIGRFFRVLDENNQLSLTNIAMWLALYKLTVTTGSYTDIGTFFVAAAAYGAKKVINNV